MAQRKAYWTSDPGVVGSNPTRDGGVTFFGFFHIFDDDVIVLDCVLTTTLLLSSTDPKKPVFSTSTKRTHGVRALPSPT